MSKRLPRVAVVYNEPVLPEGHRDAASERDVLSVAAAVAQALSVTGFKPVLLGAAPPLTGFLQRLESLGTDLIFNLVEGFAGASTGATYLTATFELAGLPYTGSPAEALAAWPRRHGRRLCSSATDCRPLLGPLRARPADSDDGLDRAGPRQAGRRGR